jgi:hypothetical protein
LETLQKGPKALGHAYGEAIKRIRSQREGFRRLAENVLLWVTCAKRLLTTSELQHALAVRIEKSTLDEKDLADTNIMVSVCAGLVMIDKKSDIIRLVHDTTREYLQTHIFCLTHESEEDPAVSGIEKNNIAMADAQNTITTICVTYLSFTVFESGFCQTDAEFEERLRLNQLYNYAANNWGNHAREALTLGQEVIGFLESEPKTKAASQALLAIKRYSGDSGYSQEVPRQMTGLHLAAYFGVYEAANILIIRGQSLDLKDSYGQTPLSWAVKNGHEAVVKLLVDKGAELEAPLLWAAEKGRKAIMKLLLKKAVDIDSKDTEYGRTPLSWTAADRREAAVKPLLEASIIEGYARLCQSIESWAAEFMDHYDERGFKSWFKEVLSGKKWRRRLKIPGIDLEKLADYDYAYFFILCYVVQRHLDEHIFKKPYPIGITDSQAEALDYIKLGKDSPSRNIGMQMFIRTISL